MQTPSVKTTQTHAFSYSRVDFNKVNKYIIENPFSPYCYSNCDKLLETWYEWLYEIMLATIPIGTNHRSSLAIWVTSPTSCIIGKLKSLQRKLNSEPSPALRNKVRSLEDLVASTINEDLMLYEESIFKSRQFSTIQTYLRYISRPDHIPTKICNENSTANTDEERSVLFNTFFCSVFSKSNDHEDECTPEFTEIPAILEDQSIEPNFSNDNITNLLQNLNPQKACGPDNLPKIMLNKCYESLANSLSVIFKTFHKKWCFPTFWKKSEVTLIFKDTDWSLVKKYRPISLLCNISKVWEKWSRKQMLKSFFRKLTHVSTVLFRSVPTSCNS